MSTKPQYHPEAIKNVNDAVYTIDLSGKFTSVNPAGVQLTGYTIDEFLQISIAHIVAPEYMELVKQKMQEKLKKDLPTVYEIEIVTKDGKHVPVEISSRALLEKGKPIGILGVARDISERKLLERQKEIFFSLITHEIKNPLSSIKAFAELLKKYHEKTNETKPLHLASMIDEQVDKLTVLVNDFLDISRMNAGKFTLTPKRFDLKELLEKIIATYNKVSAKQRIKLQAEEQYVVDADENRIGQVVTNLLSNAVKYSPKDSSIRVSIIKEKKHVTVRVADKGPGIPKANQQNIFELFYRLTNTQQDQIKGHGLGLYICKQIITGHKGEIGVESNTKGTTFYFSLPLS